MGSCFRDARCDLLVTAARHAEKYTNFSYSMLRLGVLRLSVLRLSVLALSVLRLSVLRLSVLALSVLRLSVLRLSVLKAKRAKSITNRPTLQPGGEGTCVSTSVYILYDGR